MANIELRRRLQAIGVHNVSILGRGVDSQLFTPERRCDALRAERAHRPTISSSSLWGE